MEGVNDLSDRLSEEVKSIEMARALEAAEKLRLDINDVEAMLKRIDGTRMAMSAAADEARGQVTIVRERVNWVIRELDTLRAQVVALALAMSK